MSANMIWANFSFRANSSVWQNSSQQKSITERLAELKEQNRFDANALAANQETVVYKQDSGSVATPLRAASVELEFNVLQRSREFRELQSAQLRAIEPGQLRLAEEEIRAAEQAATEEQLSGLFGAESEEVEKYGALLAEIRELNPELRRQADDLLKEMNQEEAANFMGEISAIKDKAEAQRQEAGEVGADQQVAASASATIGDLTGEDQMVRQMGRTVEKFAAEFSIEFSARSLEIVQSGVARGGILIDPIVLDLAGDGINATSMSDGVEFDLNGDGEKKQTAFIQGDDAFLFLDQNGNGVADNGKELFGDQEGHANGFAKLAEHDANGDGVIDELDEVYHKLRLWQDKDGNGESTLEETMNLLEAGIKAIQLHYADVYEDDGNGNVVAQKGSFLRHDGTAGLAVDLLLRGAE